MRKNLPPKVMQYMLPVGMIASYDEDGNADVMNAAFVAPCSHIPPCVMVAINSTLKRKTLENIKKNQEFVVQFATEDTMAEADYFGIASGKDVDKIAKSKLHVVPAEKVNAPIIEEFQFALECKVLQMTAVGSHTQIIAAIMNISAEESILDEKGQVDVTKLKPIIYDDVKKDYFKLGEKIADAFSIGREYLD